MTISLEPFGIITGFFAPDTTFTARDKYTVVLQSPQPWPTVFDMFSQVERSIERSAGGLGIGLALVKGLVEMHDGTVTAASEGPGKGSTFTVKLPVMASHAGLVASVPSGTAMRTSCTPARPISQ